MSTHLTHFWDKHLKRGYFLSDSQGGWNKHGGGAKVAKSINVEVGINVEGGICEKSLRINVEGENGRGGWIFFSKSVSLTPRLLER